MNRKHTACRILGFFLMSIVAFSQQQQSVAPPKPVGKLTPLDAAQQPSCEQLKAQLQRKVSRLAKENKSLRDDAESSASIGGNVRKGEHGTKIIFWKCKTREAESADGEIEERKSAFLRYYTVFNLEQTEGLKALLTLPPAFPIESAEEIVKGMPNPPAFERDARASYIPSRDTVTMPSRTAFQSQAEYSSTLFHELIHSTGHAKRLGREGIEKIQPFGSEDYSKEELVAEMGSAMLCGVASIEQATICNSAAYLRGWISRLKADSRLVISAARAAQEAADYILGESEQDSPVSQEECHAS